MLQKIESDIKNILTNLYQADVGLLDKLVLELSPEKLENDFDISTNIALVLSGFLGKKPMDIANEIIEKLRKIDYVENCSVTSPAFVNIRLKNNVLMEMVNDVNNFGDKNLVKNIGNGKNINVEFCSANPTGPLHIGHARGIVFGNTISNLLQKSGYNVCREYYINDAGAQMNKLEESIKWRMNGCRGNLPDGGYPGEYLQKIADKRSKVLQKKPKFTWSNTDTANEIIDYFIKPTLKRLKISYDKWSSEQDIKNKGIIEKSIDYLSKLGLVYRGTLNPPKGKVIEDYEPREQLLFKSSSFGDDIDRPLMKNDNSYTYFASDIAYHYDKWKRGFDNMIVVLGADHKGYVKRLTSVAKAVTHGNGEVHVKLCELVNFLKNGEMVKMSKRNNNFLTIDDVLDEIDPDILCFMILTRKANTVFNFDLVKAKEQSKDNAIWYIHYAYARCNSVLNRANEIGLKINKKDCNINNGDVVLSHNFRKLIVKMMFYTRFLELAVKNYEPFFFASYMVQLATDFHCLWEKEKIINEDDLQLSLLNLSIVKSFQSLIRCGLGAFNIDEIAKM